MALRQLLYSAALLYYFAGLACFAAFLLLRGRLPSDALVAHGKVAASRLLAWQVPKRHFATFYFVGLLAAVAVFEFHPQECMLALHLCRRLLESLIWPYSADSTMHVIHALVGISYYPVLITSFFLSASEFRTNGLSMAIFLGLQVWQSYIHYLLYTSRIHGGYVPLAERYSAFRHSLCPHYVAEILLYLLFAWGAEWAPLLVLNWAFAAANLGISASSTRKWYFQRFPKSRHPPALLFI